MSKLERKNQQFISRLGEIAYVLYNGVSRMSKTNRTQQTDDDGHLRTTKRIQEITHALLSKHKILRIMRTIERSISDNVYVLVKLKMESLTEQNEGLLKSFLGFPKDFMCDLFFLFEVVADSSSVGLYFYLFGSQFLFLFSG